MVGLTGPTRHALVLTAPDVADVGGDVLAFMTFPTEHWSKIHSTNPVERLNEKIRRRTRVVRIFPNTESCLIAARRDPPSDIRVYGRITPESIPGKP